jgi:hypothetical protein
MWGPIPIRWDASKGDFTPEWEGWNVLVRGQDITHESGPH